MSKFIVSTDTCCDARKSELTKRGIRYIALAYIKDGAEYRDNYESDADYKAFYESISKGALPSTTQLNEYELTEYFESILNAESGDLVHFTLSSGLSGTYNSAVSAAKAVMEKHKGRNIEVVDSLGATQSITMLLTLACKDRDDNLSAEDCAKRMRQEVARTHHIVVANDLYHLRRGGRVSSASAIFGTLLHIKPIIHVDPEGRLKVIDKVLGMKKAIRYLVKYMLTYGEDLDKQTLYIAHADCLALAEEVKAQVLEQVKTKIEIGWIGPIIGAHTGSGTMTLIFRGKARPSLAK